MIYSEVVNAWVVLLEQAPSPYTPPTDFSTVLPRAIEYATNRICRDMIFLAQRQQNSSLAFTSGVRSLDFSSLSPACLVVEGVAAITPAATAPAAGTRWQFNPMSLDTIDYTWPVEATTAPPSAEANMGWALKDDHTIVVKPTMDAAYKCEITGLFALAYINASSPTSNYITNTYPELFLAAGMIWWAGYQQNYGAQAENPAMANSWEAEYQRLLGPAQDEERRRRLLKPADGSQSRAAPLPLAQGGQG